MVSPTETSAGKNQLTWSQALAADLPASIIVFLVALPLCIGIASASGAPPATGLITGIVGGLVVALLAGSPLQVSGPAAGLFVLVAQVIDELGLIALGMVVFGAGLIQITAGWLKLGNYFRAVSPAVIQGMLSGIGVLILASEFHAMVDDHDAAKAWLDAEWPKGIANLMTMPQSFWLGIVPLDESPHHLSAGLGVATIVILLLWRFVPIQSLRVIPGAVIAVTAAALVALLMGWSDTITHVEVPDNLLDDMKLPSAWSLEGITLSAVLFAAIEIAIVASAETMLCCAAVDQMQSHVRTRYDKELLAQGVGNTLCGLLGALPMTGVIVRSSANVQAGGRTRLSAWLHGLWLLIFVAALPWLLNYIPRASLAAVLVFTGWKLINPAAIRKLWNVSKPDGIICLITLALVVGVDLLTGVLVGVACTAARLLYTFARIEIDTEEIPSEGRTNLNLRGAATFLALPRLTEVLDRVSPATELHVSLKDLTYVDHACLEQFINWEKQHEATGGRLVIDWDDLTATFRDEGKKRQPETADASE
ncbi:C4-dicarboxylic acid transporter DauA [Planctomycetes bacterium MalM25]|nr:C4-dicarboxylic acid transporter DauA [Planctomycetes bacterium MalM25]